MAQLNPVLQAFIAGQQQKMQLEQYTREKELQDFQAKMLLRQLVAEGTLPLQGQRTKQVPRPDVILPNELSFTQPDIPESLIPNAQQTFEGPHGKVGFNIEDLVTPEQNMKLKLMSMYPEIFKQAQIEGVRHAGEMEKVGAQTQGNLAVQQLRNIGNKDIQDARAELEKTLKEIGITSAEKIAQLKDEAANKRNEATNTARLQAVEIAGKYRVSAAIAGKNMAQAYTPEDMDAAAQMAQEASLGINPVKGVSKVPNLARSILKKNGEFDIGSRGKDIEAFAGIMGAMDQLEEVVNQLPEGKTAALFKGATVSTGLDRNLKNAVDQIAGRAGQFARSISGERGVLNEGDIKRSMQAVVDPYQNKSNNLKRIQNLRKDYMNRMHAILGGIPKSQFNSVMKAKGLPIFDENSSKNLYEGTKGKVLSVEEVK